MKKKRKVFLLPIPRLTTIKIIWREMLNKISKWKRKRKAHHLKRTSARLLNSARI